MIRSLLTLLLSLAFAAGAAAQTTPKAATRTKAAVRPPAGKAQPAAPGASTGTMAEMPTSTKGQSQSIYAAPGEPINVPDGKVGPYDGQAAGRHAPKPKTSTTLTPQ